MKRLLFLLALTLLAGWLLGSLRAEGRFVMGVQGALAGALLGWAAGRLGRSEPEHAWTFAFRCALVLGLGLLFTAAVLGFTSWGHAQVGDGPLTWLGAMLADERREAFFGLGRFRVQVGRMGGLAWSLFTLLDLAFFLGAGLIALGVARGRGTGPRGGSAPRRRAALAFLLPVVAAAALLLALWRPDARQAPTYAGTWRAQGGCGWMGTAPVSLVAEGQGQLRGVSEDGAFRWSVRVGRNGLRGLIYRVQPGRVSALPVRGRLSPDGRSLALVLGTGDQVRRCRLVLQGLSASASGGSASGKR